MKKRIIGFMLALSMIMACVPSVNAKAAEKLMYEAENATYDVTRERADLYVRNNREEIIYVARELADCFDYSKSQWDSLEIGESYVVNEIGRDIEDEIYYYPLIDGEDIVLVLSVFNASDGWNYSLSKEMVSQLNYIDFENNQEDYVLYYDENELLVESENGFVVFPEEEVATATFDTFALSPTSRNTRATYSSNTGLQPLTRMPGYYPRFKIDESTYKECKLVSPQGQGNYGRCWAAVCATMLNYEFGVPMTAERICDLKGIDYNEGADSKTMCETLVESGLYRRVYYEQLAWGDIITEINNKRLIGLGAYTENREYGHAVTVIGYRRISNYCYVILWNSALNGNCGERQVVVFIYILFSLSS